MKKLVVLFFLACFIYAFSFGNEFIWDDEQFIVKNVLVQNLSSWPNYFTTSTTAGAGIESNYYRPLTTLSFAIDHAIWGAHPFGFHLTNTLLHALGGVLVFIFLRELLRFHSLDRRLEQVAYLTAIAFVVHPAQVEAVAYINSRGDSLSLVYGLLTVLGTIKLQQEKSDNRRILLGVGSFFSYLIVLLTKESGIVWVGIVLFYILFLRVHGKKIRPGVFVVAGFQLATAFVYLALRFTVLQFQSTQEIWGVSSVYANSLIIRLGTFFTQAVPQYVEVLFWPKDLRMERDVAIIRDLQLIPITSFILLFTLLAVVVGASIYLLKKREKLSHPFFIGAVLFAILMLPFTNIMPLNGIMYEHWLYAPMIGWWLICIYFLDRVLSRKFYLIVLITVFIFWGVLSVRQIFIWKSPMTLYPHILQYTNSARVHMNLGMAYAEQKNNEQALYHYNTAVELADRYPQTHHNIGNIYLATGEYEKAAGEYEKALAIDPYFTFSLDLLIQLEIALKHKEKAEHWAKYGLEKFPGNPRFIELAQRVKSAQW